MHDVIERNGYLYDFDKHAKKKDTIVVGFLLLGCIIVSLMIYPINIGLEEDIISLGVIIIFSVVVLLILLFELKPSYFTPEMFVYQPAWSFKRPKKIKYSEISEIEANYTIGVGVLVVKCRDKNYTLVEGEKNLNKIIAYLKKIKRDHLVKIVK